MQAALEWQAEKQSTCSGCGQSRHESMAKQNWDAYTADEVVCHACAAIDRRKNAIRETKGADTDGLLFTVRMIDKPD